MFLVELLTTAVLTVFFLFYFNRLFSTVVFYAIRAFTWRQYRAYIDVQSLQISLLGGRIFFKDLRYHAHNETILVHSGFITWRYWLRKVRSAEVFVDGDGKREKQADKHADAEDKGGRLANNKKLPCRLEIKVSGVEAFLYNRSPAYDYILENVARKEHEATRFGSAPDVTEKPPLSSPNTTSSEETAKPVQLTDSLDEVPGSSGTAAAAVYRKPPLPVFLRLFPIYVECKRAAAVLGNENTRSILTVKIDGASGVFDAAPAGALDVYRQLFAFEVQHPIITMKPNVDYRETQLATAVRLKEEAQLGIPVEETVTRSRWLSQRPRKAWHALRHLVPQARASLLSLASEGANTAKARKSTIVPNIPGQDQWQGLARYLDDVANDEHSEWDPVEYARSSTLADVTRVDFTFYWDVPGPVSAIVDDVINGQTADEDDLNGATPPGYGMDLHVYAGQVTYGPWADRHRIDFQSYFFPPTYVDAVAAKRLNAGQYREFSVFKLYLAVEEDVTLRLPFRENSKDWQWKGQAEGMLKKNASKDQDKLRGRHKLFSRDKAGAAPNVRPFGWLDVKVMADSTINFSQDMLARKSGYRNGLTGDIKGTEMTTSVNHGLLWRSGGFALDLDLSYPLGWNALRDWRFDIVGNDVDVFILRDHLFLMTDLILDWSTGPPIDFFAFVPFLYNLNIDFRRFKLNLNTNDANIINEPASFDDNNFIILGGDRLTGQVRIPLDKYQPVRNEIPFSVKGLDFFLDQVMPPKSTLGTFPSHKRIATLDEVTLTGSHTAFQETSIALTDTLVFDIHGSRFLLIMYGWLVHYFVRIKENYFGDDLHFKTLEEYQQSLADGGDMEDFLADRASNRGNDLDVILAIRVDEATAVLPGNMYTVAEAVAIDVPFATVDLRINNYYMDLQLDLSPISISQGSVTYEKDIPHCQPGQTQIFIDGVRLLGHRFFGLPPAEPAYVNTWDVDAGDITGELQEDFVCVLARAAQVFAVSAPDAENTLTAAHPIVIHDVVFLMLTTKTVHLWVHVGQNALLVGVTDTSVEFNDLFGSVFSGRVNVTVPEITVACVDCRGVTRKSSTVGGSLRLPATAYLATSLRLNVLQKGARFTQQKMLQQAHIRMNDRRTQRCPFLLDTGGGASTVSDNLSDGRFEPAASLAPGLPLPIGFAHSSSASSTASAMSTILRRSTHTSQSNRQRDDRSILTNNSRASLAESVAAMQGHPSRGAARPRRMPHALDHVVRSIADDVSLTSVQLHDHTTASVVFSSPVARPVFPLDRVELDLQLLPALPTTQRAPDRVRTGDRALIFEDEGTHTVDDHLDRTSLIIDVGLGIRGFFTPFALDVPADLMAALQPQNMDDMVDALHCGILSGIASQKTDGGETGKSLDLSLKIPAACFAIVDDFGSGRDRVDLRLGSVNLTLKTVQPPGHRMDADLLSVHVMLEHLSLSLKNDRLGASEQFSIDIRMDQVLLWLAQKESLSVNLTFRSLRLDAATGDIEGVASFAERTVVLVEQTVARFAEINAERARRLQFMAYHLTMAGDNAPDPPFLTRLSYAMRASESHMRNQDAWRIVSRFRYIYQTLSRDSQHLLSENLVNPSIRLPADAESEVLERWEGRRAWEQPHIVDSTAIRAIYGIEDASIVEARPTSAMDIAVRSADVRLVLDRGPHETKLACGDLTLILSVIPPPVPSGLMLEPDGARKAIVAQLNMQSLTIHLGWAICRLVDRTVETVLSSERYRDALFKFQKTPAQAQHKSTASGTDYQLVLAVEDTAISLQTLNLRSENIAHKMKLSLIGSEIGQGKPDQAVSAVLHAETATADLHASNKHLLRLQSREPSILVAQKTSTSGGRREEEVKVVGSTSAVLTQVKEQVLGLIEVADAVIRDEAAYFKEMVIKLAPLADNLQASSSSMKAPATPRTLPRLAIALEMGAYRFDVALLQALSYSLTGKTGRLLVIPDLEKNLALNIALDLEKHHHHLTSNDTKGEDNIAVLGLPSINGQVSLTQEREDQPIKLESSLIVDVIQIDASALHALTETFKRPEVGKTFDTLMADIDTVGKTYRGVFPSKRAATPAHVESASISLPLDYRVNVLVAGITVTAAASTLSNRAQAKLTFGITRTQAVISNRAQEGKGLTALPDMRGQIARIFADLQVITQAETRHCGDVSVGVNVHCSVHADEQGGEHYDYHVSSSSLRINLFAETASAVVDVVNNLQDRLKDLNLSQEKRYLQRLQLGRRHPSHVAIAESPRAEGVPDPPPTSHDALFASAISIKLMHIEVRWIVGNSVPAIPGYADEDLVFSIRRIELGTRSEDTAQLSIVDLQLAMLGPDDQAFEGRSQNSALLPEVVFNVAHRSTAGERSLWLHAAGKPLEILLEPRFVLPASVLERSITLAVDKVRSATATWQATPTAAGNPRKNPFGNKKLRSLIVEADFAGAIIHLQKRKGQSRHGSRMLSSAGHQPRGPFGQLTDDGPTGTTSVRSPGLAIRAQYNSAPEESLNVEIRLDASSNTLYPTVVPLIIEISDTVKEVVRHSEDRSPREPVTPPPKPPQKFLEDSDLFTADPSRVLGGIKLNLGFRICKQEFSLSCQPVARVAATARFDDIYLTVNTVRSGEHGHFFALSFAIDNLQASVQHVYSRESTFSFDAESIVLSLINSKHLSGTAGISAMLKVSPMRMHVNARQLQDFLLFREIWFPQEIRQPQPPTVETPATNAGPEEYLVARYQQISEAAAFPWTATVLFQEMSVELDLGQAIGKSSFRIMQLWASSKKNSSWEQNLCIGADSIGIDGTGRMSGLVELDHLKVRTSITWPRLDGGPKQTPRISASAGFERLKLKAAFDYQAFAVADITAFNFMMYNVRVEQGRHNDRLVAVLNGGRVQVYLTATAAAQTVALAQAFERLIQDNTAAYEQSLKDVEKFLRRKSSVIPSAMRAQAKAALHSDKRDHSRLKAPISLHTDVVVTLQALSVGAFPGSLTDNQILLFEALDAQTRFAVALEDGRVHSGLGMTLGQLKVALASMQHPAGGGAPRSVGDIAIADVVDTVRLRAKGGTILRVPKVVAAMQTWQRQDDNQIDYIFKSSFEGKVDVGWNFSRISFIRGMWTTHSRSLATRLGKPLPESAVKITTDGEHPSPTSAAKSDDPATDKDNEAKQKKITAVVNVPQSRYDYRALEPPIIETPQLRDMGEATPPLEWIGLHRDRLPNVTHQVIIIALLEVAKEVEDAYGRILGRS